LRLTECSEVSFTARNGGDSRYPFLLACVLLHVSAVIEAHDCAVGFSDAGHDRGELQITVRYMHRYHTVRLQLVEVRPHHFAGEKMNGDRGTEERIDKNEVVASVWGICKCEPRVTDDDWYVRRAF